MSSNDLALTATDLPTRTFGFFITSRTVSPQPQPNGVQGELCHSQDIGRFVDPGQVQSTGAAGEISIPVDLTALPQPTSMVAAVLGETWAFQAWTRDSQRGQANGPSALSERTVVTNHVVDSSPATCSPVPSIGAAPAWC